MRGFERVGESSAAVLRVLANLARECKRSRRVGCGMKERHAPRQLDAAIRAPELAYRFRVCRLPWRILLAKSKSSLRHASVKKRR